MNQRNQLWYWIPLVGIFLMLKDARKPGKLDWYSTEFYVGELWKPWQIITVGTLILILMDLTK